MVSRYFFFPKADDLFSHRLWIVMTFLAVVSLPPRVTPSRGDTRLKLIFAAEFRKKNTKFRHKKIIIVGCHPSESVTRLPP